MNELNNTVKSGGEWREGVEDEWRCRATLMKTEKGLYYCKLELRSEVSPEYISFVNVHLNRSEKEIEQQVRYSAAQLAEHQNQRYNDKHNFVSIENAAWESFRQMMLEIAEAGIEL